MIISSKFSFFGYNISWFLFVFVGLHFSWPYCWDLLIKFEIVYLIHQLLKKASARLISIQLFFLVFFKSIQIKTRKRFLTIYIFTYQIRFTHLMMHVAEVLLTITKKEALKIILISYCVGY